ncbi:HAD family hydrolase [Cellulomonas alba]|uniref:HAD family hydrolase n=1 Tax=Cellulomonas alba TaxID=3053467 RepID=A0ABT7SDL5_9CELL|nr:HAD family hydrolase [Cellulomonas alba]MDM7854278.1 HAD family hydrolase [Cellulomonas alba]
MAVRGVLLDFYGTVVEDDDHTVAALCADVGASVHAPAEVVARVWTAAWRALCAESTGASFRTQRALARESLAMTLRELGSPLDVDPLHARQVARWAEPRAYDDAVALLAELRRRDLPVCVVSDVDDADLEASIDRAGLDLPRRVTSQQARAYKPDARPFLLALDLLGLEAADVVHVGDSVSSDVDGAAALGIRAVWVDRRGRGTAQAERATWAVPDLYGLGAVLAAAG